LNLNKICKPDPAKRKQIEQQDFKEWFRRTKDCYWQFEGAFNHRKYKLAEGGRQTDAIVTADIDIPDRSQAGDIVLGHIEQAGRHSGMLAKEIPLEK
jgi:hypothetical protein